jgi:hypothetical protein
MLHWEQALYNQRVHELKAWPTENLLYAKNWWATTGVELCGKQAAFNAYGQILAALKAR